MSKNLNAIVMGVALALMAVPSMAIEKDSRVETTSVPAILENLDSIDAAMAASDARLAGLSERDKRDLSAEQAKVRKILAGRNTLEDLGARDRLVAFNALETIHGIVTGNREERVICRRDHVTGSNRPQTQCMTAREREEARKASIMAMAVRGNMLRQEGL